VGIVAIRAEGRWEGKREGKAFERSFGMGGGRATRGWTALSGLAISLGSIKQRKSSSVRRKGGKRPTRGGADQPVAKRREETLVACVHEDDPLRGQAALPSLGGGVEETVGGGSGLLASRGETEGPVEFWVSTSTAKRNFRVRN